MYTGGYVILFSQEFNWQGGRPGETLDIGSISDVDPDPHHSGLPYPDPRIIDPGSK